MTQPIEDHAAPFSPRAVREARFSHRRRGVDETEVRHFLQNLAEQIQSSDAERAQLRAEIESLRDKLRDTESTSTAISPQAIALFSQAQQVADSLVAEAVEHARDMMTATRAQQREILQRAHDTAQAAARNHHPSSEPHGDRPGAHSGSPHVPEIEYVRTFAKVAQVQLRSVLDALTEQVDKLGDVPGVDTARPPSRVALATGRGSDRADLLLDPEATVSWQLSAGPVVSDNLNPQPAEHR